MRLRSLRGKGWVPFRTEFEVNFESLNGVITAIVGENGSGKSSLLELFAGCLYRKMPTRGSLKDFAATRDAFVECSIVNGDEYRIRQTVDGFSGKAETSLTSADGRALLVSGKVTEFGKWADAHLPAPAVFYSSLFAAQGSKGLLGMDPADRKSVILKVLGLERLEALAQLARQHKAAVSEELAGVRARVDELRGGQEPEGYAEEIIRLEADVRTAEEELRLGEITLADLRKKNEGAVKAKAEMDATLARITELDARVTGLRERIVELRKKIEAAHAVLNERPAIEKAVARHAELTTEMETLRNKRHALEVTGTEVEGRLARLFQRERDQTARRDRLKAAISVANGTIAHKDAVEESGRLAEQYEAHRKAAEEQITKTWQELEFARATASKGDAGRIKFLRGSLTAISNGDSGPAVKPYAAKALKDDESAAKMIANLPKETEHLILLWQEQKVTHQKLVDRRDKARLQFARLPEIEAAEKAKAEAERELASVPEEYFGDVRAELNRQLNSVSTKLDQTRQRIHQTQSALISLQMMADRVGLLAHAEKLLTDYVEQLEDLTEEKERLLADRYLLDCSLPVVAPILINLDEYVRAIANARTRAQTYGTSLAVAKHNKQMAEDMAVRRAGYTAQLKALEDHVADWTRLADDLGKGGLQALEIDCAGPELTVLANDLLRSCGDTRFSVEVSTTRQDATGKKELEVCDILVMDSQDGLTQSAETLSGGEAVFVGEALSLALTMVGVRRNGITAPTLIRDETGAALDPARGSQYIAMLRRAAEIVGASRILFVSHSADLQALADSVIEVSDGVVR